MKKVSSVRNRRRQKMSFYKYAGFWRRFIAYMIDGCIITIVIFILAMIAGIAFFTGIMSGSNTSWILGINDPEQILSFTLWFWIFSTLINIAYFTYFHGATGRTPGKSLLGVQVVSIEGTSISFGTAFLRSVGYMVSSLVFCLGFIWIGFDKKKQGWHDKIAGTVVIVREPQNNAAGISIPDSSTITEAQQMRQDEEFKEQNDQMDKIPENNG
jgi:uncharacterized RDD family membrane protein YckC